MVVSSFDRQLKACVEKGKGQSAFFGLWKYTRFLFYFFDFHENIEVSIVSFGCHLCSCFPFEPLWSVPDEVSSVYLRLP